MAKLTIFSWGYWGWGNEAARFVEAVDAVEASRGFAPPAFVDIRIRRSVRAKQFQDDAFEEIVGRERYLWMNGLGNQAVIDPSLGHINILRPQDAKVLLEDAVVENQKKRRIIFFCACADAAHCHRRRVGTLLLDTARRLGQKLDVAEWPGSLPSVIKEHLNEEIFRKVRAGAKTIPLLSHADLALYAGLGWGSTVEVTSGEQRSWFLTGPALRKKDSWCLPVLQGPFKTKAAAAGRSDSFRRRGGYLPRHA